MYQSRGDTFRKHSNVLLFFFETQTHFSSFLYKLIGDRHAGAHRHRRGGGREAAAPLVEHKFAIFGQFF